MVGGRFAGPAFLAHTGQDFPLRPAAFVRTTHKGTPFANKKYVVKRAGSPYVLYKSKRIPKHGRWEIY